MASSKHASGAPEDPAVVDGFRSLIERAPEAVVVHRGGSVIYANPAARSLLGYVDSDDTHPSDEIVGRAVLDFVHADDRALYAAGLPDEESARGSTPFREIRFVDRRGGAVPCEARATRVMWDQKPAVATIGRDMGERRRLEAQLLVDDRVASLSIMMAGIAHEVNNPLAYLMANLRYLTEELSEIAGLLPEGRMLDLFDALEDATAGAERIHSLVSDLEAISRPGDDGSPPVSPVSVVRVLETAIVLGSGDVSDRARFEKDLGEVPEVLANEARLGQVFLCLIENAAAALQPSLFERNCIRVRSFVASQPPRVVVEISDNGDGIAAEPLARLFDPFFTTRHFGRGKGVSLAVSHGLIAGFGGELTARSELGKGTVFRVTLPPLQPAVEVEAGSEPLLAPSPDPTSEAPPTSPALETRRGQLLLIDDEPMILSSLRRLLGGEHDLTVAESGAEALNHLLGGARFDAILCDLMMPGINGIAVYEKLLQLAPDQASRMLFMSGGAFTARTRLFLDEVPNRRVQKPFDGQRLKRLVREIIGQGQGQGQG